MSRKLVREFFRFANGQVASNTEIAVVGRGNSLLAPLYASLVGPVAHPNPALTDDQGGLAFYAEEGLYDFLALGARVPFDVVGATASEGYVHDQTNPAATWTMAHPLGRLPGVTVLDDTSRMVLVDLEFPDLATVVATFATPTTGRAIFS